MTQYDIEQYEKKIQIIEERLAKSIEDFDELADEFDEGDNIDDYRIDTLSNSLDSVVKTINNVINDLEVEDFLLHGPKGTEPKQHTI